MIKRYVALKEMHFGEFLKTLVGWTLETQFPIFFIVEITIVFHQILFLIKFLVAQVTFGN